MEVLNCPFCDESTKALPKGKICSAGKIYTPRICKMGHKVYSVEEIPENQSKVEEEIQAIREYQRLKRKKKVAERKAKRVSSI